MTMPCIVVAGMGRCGTSLMMQMLHAAGVPCVGEWPAFETDASAIGSFEPLAFASRTGQAIKLIDPANLKIGDMPNHVVIWLDRDSREQAKSQVKFAQLSVGRLPNTRLAIRAMEAGLRKTRSRHRSRVGIPSVCPHIDVRFENLIEAPHVTAGEISDFLGRHGWGGLDARIMASQVRRRSPQCYRGFLEAELLRERGAA